MTLIIGGVGQGKLDYVLQKTGHAMLDVAHNPQEARQRPIFTDLATWVRNTERTDEAMDDLLAQNPEVIIICDEVGCGVVPLLAEERAWRERVGRLCCNLAKVAKRVERVLCGLPMVLKGDGEWN